MFEYDVNVHDEKGPFTFKVIAESLEEGIAEVSKYYKKGDFSVVPSDWEETTKED